MANDLDFFVEAFNQYIVTPINAFGLGGFVFDLEGKTSVNLKSEITDNWLEDNTTVQDHIARKPKRITLKNYVGELVYRNDGAGESIVERVAQKLTILNSYLPQLAAGAEQLKEVIDSEKTFDLSFSATLENINKTVDYWALVKNLSASESRQQQAYMYFKALWERNILFSVQTPFEFLPNMAIEEVIADQDEETKYISSFTLTLKQLRFAQIISTDLDPTKLRSPDKDVSTVQQKSTNPTLPFDMPEQQGRNSSQSAPPLSVGNMEGLPTPPNVEEIQNILNQLHQFNDLPQ